MAYRNTVLAHQLLGQRYSVCDRRVSDCAVLAAHLNADTIAVGDRTVHSTAARRLTITVLAAAHSPCSARIRDGLIHSGIIYKIMRARLACIAAGRAEIICIALRRVCLIASVV